MCYFGVGVGIYTFQAIVVREASSSIARNRFLQEISTALIGINGGAGLGHKVTDVYFGMLFARENRAKTLKTKQGENPENRATFVLDAARFNLNGSHGNYLKTQPSLKTQN